MKLNFDKIAEIATAKLPEYLKRSFLMTELLNDPTLTGDLISLMNLQIKHSQEKIAQSKIELQTARHYIANSKEDKRKKNLLTKEMALQKIDDFIGQEKKN